MIVDIWITLVVEAARSLRQVSYIILQDRWQ
jgi:hypothetical protein